MDFIAFDHALKGIYLYLACRLHKEKDNPTPTMVVTQQKLTRIAMHTFRFIPLLFLFFLIQGCATHTTQIRKVEQSWMDQTPPAESQRIHTMYLLGDAGYSSFKHTAPPIRHLGKVLKAADENSSLVVLGDNIYPDGLPPEDHPTYELSAHRLNVQLDIMKDFKGKPFIIPGNHEYVFDGSDGVKRQEKFVKKYLDRKDVFRPEKGCSGPDKEKLHEDIVVVFIDSQWWIADWDNTPEMNEGCAAKSKSVFLDEFHNVLKKEPGPDCRGCPPPPAFHQWFPWRAVFVERSPFPPHTAQ
jgi:hypothetical protein